PFTLLFIDQFLFISPDLKYDFLLLSVIHTLRYFETASSQISGFPQYVSVGLVNDLVITHYDSNTKRTVPKQEWMNRVTEDESQYWETETQINVNNEQVGKYNIEIVKQRLNEIGGSHLYQRMSGCDWNDETNEIRGYFQTAFDGEDFISLDWETQTWVAPKQQAFDTKLRWERNGVALRYKDYFDHRCADALKRYVRYGEKTLKRKELPEVWFLQKSSSSWVTCFATGFYPDRAMLFWTKDGEELLEDWGGILPNHDGTFQSSVSLDLSSVPTGDWGRYSCVFQLSGVKDDLITKLDPGLIRTNGETDEVREEPQLEFSCSYLADIMSIHKHSRALCEENSNISPKSRSPRCIMQLYMEKEFILVRI
uniref:Ig-like domain-containing protein n=1 Tax=Neogobius melanostomus TaxID=47308 RepID=A0A8C6S9Y9_9GOBI